MKYVVCLIALLLMLTACNAPAEPTGTADPTTVTDATTAPTTDATTAPTTETTTAATTDAVGFSTDDAAFTLELPREWHGHYAVRETADTVTLYELQNHQQSGQGKLFSIRYIPESQYSEGMLPSYRELGTFDGYRVVAVFPTDVQFDMELMEPYTAMQAQIDSILATFYHLSESGDG